MSRKKKTILHQDIEITFTKQNDNQVREDNRLNIEMLRVNATEKQRIMKDIWLMQQDQLCDFFTTYRLFPQSVLSIKELLDSNNLKLIKNAGKIYFGQVERKKKSGKGICIYKEGKIYEGEFQDNEKTGLGVQIYSNSNLYIGDFLNNKKHGKGQFFWFNLLPKAKESPERRIQYYDGEWWGGLPDGEGLHQKMNGDLYLGTFKNGLKHGLGTQNFGNGDYYKGEYINGLPEGFGEYIWADGSYYKGDFKQGLRSGYGFWSLNNKSQEGFKQQYQGHYAMDKKSGYGVYEWENGWIYKGNFQNDFRNGFGQLYDGDKAVYRGFWENGEQTDSDRNAFGKTTSRTNASMQMSRGSAFAKTTDLNSRKLLVDQQGYQTLQSGSLVPSRYRVQPKLTARPEFTIKKRPQSHATLQKSQAKRKSASKKTNQFTGSIGTSLSRPILKNHLYVPGAMSERSRGY